MSASPALRRWWRSSSAWRRRWPTRTGRASSTTTSRPTTSWSAPSARCWWSTGAAPCAWRMRVRRGSTARRSTCRPSRRRRAPPTAVRMSTASAPACSTPCSCARRPGRKRPRNSGASRARAWSSRPRARSGAPCPPRSGRSSRARSNRIRRGATRTRARCLPTSAPGATASAWTRTARAHASASVALHRRHGRRAWLALAAASSLLALLVVLFGERLQEYARWGGPAVVEDFADDSWSKRWIPGMGSYHRDGDALVSGSGSFNTVWLDTASAPERHRHRIRRGRHRPRGVARRHRRGVEPGRPSRRQRARS